MSLPAAAFLRKSTSGGTPWEDATLITEGTAYGKMNSFFTLALRSVAGAPLELEPSIQPWLTSALVFEWELKADNFESFHNTTWSVGL